MNLPPQPCCRFAQPFYILPLSRRPHPKMRGPSQLAQLIRSRILVRHADPAGCPSDPSDSRPRNPAVSGPSYWHGGKPGTKGYVPLKGAGRKVRSGPPLSNQVTGHPGPKPPAPTPKRQVESRWPSAPEALTASLPPRSLRLLPAGATDAGWVYLPLRERTFSRRTRWQAKQSCPIHLTTEKRDDALDEER